MQDERRFRLKGFLRDYWRIGLALGAVLGLLNFTYFYLDDVTRGVDSPILEPFIEEMTSSFGVAALVPLIVWMAFRFPLDRSGRLARVPFQLFGLVVFSAAHTLWNWGTRVALFPLAGLEAYDYGAMPVRFFMEFPSDLIIYALVLTLAYLIEGYRRAQAQRVAFSRLETRLARSQLENLRTRLHPHFLFNALHTVSSVMYESPAAADTMLRKLSELLRRTMDGEAAARQEVALSEELAALELYLDIMRARFGERLRVDLDVAPETRSARVPALMLQPLVENALRHGEPAPPQVARITVKAEREGERLRLTVVDNGPGFLDPEAARSGNSVGLPNTVARLEQLYGEEASLILDNGLDGGARVRVELPFRPTQAVGAASRAASSSASGGVGAP